MHQERLQALRLRYPAVYGNTLRTECGDGWFGILDALGEQLVRQAELEHRVATEIRMFKEKFGTLRLGKTAQTIADAAYCQMAITMSFRICEVCGCPGDHFGTIVRCGTHDQILDARAYEGAQYTERTTQ